jgi:hypothetical protein
LAQSAVVAAAKKQGLRFLVEGSNQLSNKNSALGRFTDSAFGFGVEGTSFVVQASTEHQGFGVYPFNAQAAAENVKLKSAIGHSFAIEDNAIIPNATQGFLASVVRQDARSTEPTSLVTRFSNDLTPQSFSDNLTTQGVAVTPSSGFVNGDISWTPWRASYDANATRRECKKYTYGGAYCVNYAGGQVRTVFYTPRFAVAKWYGSTKICGSPTIDLNVNCSAAYSNVTQTSKGESETVGGSLEIDVGVSVGGKAGVPLVAEGTVEASLNVRARAEYGKTWTNDSSYTFSTTDTVNIKGGYMARFGKGDWRVDFDTRINSRWERRTHEVVDASGVGAYKHTYATEPDGRRVQCTAIATGNLILGQKRFDWRCTYTYRNNQNILHRHGSLTVLGADYWAICKQKDTTCVNTQINNAGGAQLKL